MHRSHRVDDLVDVLATVLGEPLDDPLARELVLVGSAGMARWLEGELAARSPARGHAAVDVLFPRNYVAALATRVLGEEPPSTDPWDPGLLRWTLADTVLEQLDEPVVGDDAWARVRRHVGDGQAAPGGGRAIDRRLLVLADRMARQLDRYALLRPEMVAAWSRGDDVGPDGTSPLAAGEGWQPRLLRAMESRLDVAAPSRRVASAVEALRTRLDAPLALPPRLCVVGVATLPRLHLDLLATAAGHVPVHLLLASPSPSAWDAGVGADGQEPAPPRNPLLRAAGPVGRDAAALVRAASAAAGVRLVDHGPVGAVQAAPAAPADARPDTVLAAVQRGVVDDVDPSGAAVRAAPDRTVQLHGCQGVLRQVEALRDDLRHRFAADETLRPRDVVVLTPDVATHGPLVQAVLGADGADGGPPALPVAVADRGVAEGDELATALLRAVRLVRARATAGAVLDLLTTGPVLRQHGVEPAQVDQLERWVDAVGVAWGRDAADRVAAGQPDDEHHTWRAGLDRLLLGVAVTGEDPGRTFAEVPPHDVEDTGDLVLLEALVRFLAVVDDLRALDRAATPAAWHADLVALLDDLTGPPDGPPSLDREARGAHQRARQRVDGALSTLLVVEDANVRALTPDAVLHWLESALAEAVGAAGYATGRVTVAGLVPLRAVPYRVVCLLGLDEGSFPRTAGHALDDVVAAGRRVHGDADARAEDRHAFLEAVLAARDALVVCWTARDPRRGEDRVPAVPVAELRDVLDVVVDGGAAALTTLHPALPTSPRAFAPGDGRASFDADRASAAAASLAPARRPAPFVPSPLQPDDTARELLLEDVVATAQRPARALVRRLQVAGERELRRLPSSEPLEVGASTRSRLGGRLLAWMDEGIDVAAGAQRLLAGGVVPAGTLGRVLLAGVVDEANDLHRFRAAFGERRQHRLDVALGDRQVVGRIGAATTAEHGPVVVDVRFARLSVEHRVAAWVRHLALQVATGGGWTVLARRGGREGPATTVLAPLADVDGAAALLARWVDLHASARRGRVAFIPRVSWTWVERRLDHPDEPEARSSRIAAEQYEPYPDPYWAQPVAWDDPDVRLLFRDLPTFEELAAGTDLLELSMELLAPLHACLADGAAHGGELAAAAPRVPA